MADDIRLVIGVEQSGLLKAITNTESLEAKVKKLSAAYARDAASYGRYNKAIGDLAKATNKNKKELLAYGTALRADEKATKKAAAEVKAFTAARKQAAEEDRRRTSEIKKATQGAKLQAAEEERLKGKFVAGHNAMTIYSKELNDLATARKRGILSAEQQQVALSRLNKDYAAGAGQFANYGNAAGFAGKRVNRMGVGLQQAGYQVGDFAVQIQGGTNAAVALGQQGAQLLGIFGPAGAIAGAALAITTAFVAPLMRANKEVKDLISKGKELAESYTDRLNAIKFGVDNEVEIKAAQKLFSLQKQDRALRERMRNTDSLSLKQSMAEEIKANRLLLIPARELSEELKSRREQYEVVKALSGSETQEAQNLLEINRNANRVRVARVKQQSKVNQAAKEELRLQSQVLELQSAERAYGKDSVEYTRLAGSIERENLVLKMETAGVDQEIIDKILSGNMRLEIGRELLAKQVQEAKELKEQLAIISKMDFPNLSVAEGAYASQLALYGSQTGPKGPTKTTTASKKTGGKTDKEKLAEYLSGKRQELALETKLVAIFGTERDIQTELFNIKNQYSKVITSEQREELEGILRLTQAEKERQAALEEAAAQQQQLADLIGNSMEKSMMGIVDGTMSVKDAFKSMAAEIIKELYRVLVVQEMVATAKEAMDAKGGFLKMVGGFFGMPTFADGGAFSGGSQIQAYADGGVVNGPTNFPMAGGKTGLMGEAGPEAIMPLKRGSNGKLGVQMEGGSQGNVVINQSFNFQANGDDSVKKLIAQAAPKIADMAKASVIDSRRRGGSTKAAFG